jgi:hypothetical protein
MGRKKALRWDQLFHISIPEYDVSQALSLAMTNMKLDLAVSSHRARIRQQG